MTFKSLGVGDVFKFMGEIEHPYSGFARGPWRKTSARGYTHVDSGGKYAVGSVSAKVQLERKSNPPLATTLRRDVWVPAKVMVTKAGKIVAKIAASAKANPVRKRKPAKRKRAAARRRR